MSDEKHPVNPVTQLLSTENLALLKRSDRFVILGLGLLVVAALGALAALRAYPVVATILALVAMVLVAGLVALVQLRAVTMEQAEADLLNMSKAAKAVNGEWWEVVYAKDHPGLSYVCIAISEVAERNAMHGITFDGNGRRVARWSSDAVAVKTSTPLEMYYIWKGTLLDPGEASLISGIGRFRFDSVGQEKRPLQGEGAFTRGSTNELRFGTPRAVELVRFTEEESSRSAKDPSCLPELARAAFARFGLEGGRTFLERMLLSPGHGRPD
jgi:hypothetical protein